MPTTQLFVFLFPVTQHDSLARLQSCVSSLSDWFLQNGLTLNTDKTEAICIGTSPRLRTLDQLSSFRISDSTIDLAHHIKLLGITLDCNLNLDNHISNVCSASYFYTKSLRRIRPYIDLSTAKSIASSIVGSRLDYANSILYGIPKRNILRLQRAQNALARVVTADHLASSHSLLSSLHWLPVQQRINYKLATMVYKSVNSSAPPYLSRLLRLYTPSRQLRSSEQYLLSTPRTHTTFGSRGFRVCGPRIWNSLPHSIRCSETFPQFREHLKTHLFREIGP